MNNYGKDVFPGAKVLLLLRNNEKKGVQLLVVKQL